jgi:hypothetical protein
MMIRQLATVSTGVVMKSAISMTRLLVQTRVAPALRRSCSWMMRISSLKRIA